MRAAVALLASSFALSFSAPASAATGVPCSFYGIDPGAPSDGSTILLDAAYADRLATAGAGAVRVDFQLSGAGGWTAAELAVYDEIIDAIRDAGMTPLGVLSYRTVPAGQEVWNDDPDGDGDNDYVRVFAETSKALFSHFAGRVARWEIWSQPNCFTNPAYASEPEIAGCTYLLPRVFARMLGGVYLQNEELFTAGKVSLVAGGLLAVDDAASPTGFDYLNELYAQPYWTRFESSAGQRYPWSYLGVQLFIDQLLETDRVSLGGYLDSVRQVAAQFNDPSRFYVTGMGWTTGLLNEELQAANLSTAMGYLARRADVAAAYWYGYSDDPDLGEEYGLVTETGAPKVALTAMRGAAAGCEADASSGADSGGGGNNPTGVTPPGPFGGAGKTAPYNAEGRDSSCSLTAGPAALSGGRGGAVGWLALLAFAALRARPCGARTLRTTARRVT